MDSENQAKTANRADERPVSILALTRQGAGLALRLHAKIPGSICYVPERHRFAIAMGARGFERAGAVFPHVWQSSRALICIMATGIVVRQVAPLLRHKALDPAVVVVDERGQFVISLVSGHLGGANRLAREVAGITGGQAVITTASDVQKKPAIDLIARKAGLDIENPEMLSRAARAILEDEPVKLFDPEDRLGPHLGDFPVVFSALHERESQCEGRSALHSASSPHESSSVVLWVSERVASPRHNTLCLRPRNLVVGLGCNRGTSAEEILELIRSVFEQEALSLLSIRDLTSVDVKSDEPGLLEAARALGRPIRFYARGEIDSITVPNPSNIVAKHIGVQSVCEATALLSAQSGKLLVPKQKAANVTLAIARVACQS